MNIQFENIDEVSALLKVTVEKSDYQEKVDKSLKTLRQKANIPGFRPGMVPMGLIKRQYENAVKAEEINKILQEKIYEYIRDEKVNMLGEPLPNEEKQQTMNFDTTNDFEFDFTIALAPKFDATLSAKDTIVYYNVEPTDEMVEDQVRMYASRNGEYKNAEQYQERDMLKGLLVESDENGTPKEGGIQVEGAVLLPAYMKEESEKNKFKASKVGDTILFNPSRAYGNNAELASLLKKKKEEVADMTSDFTLQIEEINHFQEGELNQKLFDEVYGEGTVKSEEEFRAKIKEGLAENFRTESDYKFLLDVKTYLLGRAGKLQFPDELLKRIMKMNNPEKEDSFVEENYEKSIEELTWHLAKEQLVEQFGIKIETEDLLAVARESTRAQFARYGMMSLPDELVENYAKEMLKKKEAQEGLLNRAVEQRLTQEAKKTVTLEPETISADAFNKLSKEEEPETK